MKKQKFLIKVIGLMIAVMLLGIANAFPVTTTWDGSAGSAWLDPDNWDTGNVPTAADNVVITEDGTSPIISVAGALCNNLTFDLGVATALQIQNPGTLTPSANATISTAPSSGAFAATINGTGALTALGALNITNNSTSLFSILITGALTGSGSNAITFSGGENITVGSIIAGATVPVTISMADLTDVVEFQGTNSYGGATSIIRGMLTTSSSDKIPDASNVDISGSAANAGLTIAGNETIGALTGTGNITMAAFTLNVSQNTNTTFFGIIGVGGTLGKLSKSGTGILSLSGASLYTGITNVNAGKLNLQNNTAAGTIAGGIVVASNAGLQLQGGIAVGDEALTLGAGTAIELESVSGTNSYDGLITIDDGCEITCTLNALTITRGITGGNVVFGGAGDTSITTVAYDDGGGTNTLTKNGIGTLTLGFANTYAGVTTITEGTVVVSSVTGLGPPGGGAGGKTIVESGAALHISGPIIIANEELTLSGTAALENILGANTWGAAGVGDIDLVAVSSIKNSVGASTLTILAPIDKDTFLLTFIGSGNITCSDPISGSGGITINMDDLTDVVTLGGANDYTGTTTITKGMLTTAAGAERITDTSPVNIAGAAADAGLTIGISEKIGGLEGSGDITMAALTLTIDDQGTDYTYSGVIGIGNTDGSIVKQGAGTLTLSGTNLFTGTVLISVGKIKAISAAALGTVAAGDITTVTAGATLQYSTLGGAFAAELLTLNGGSALENLDGTNSMAGLITLGAAPNIITGTAGSLTLSGGVTLAQNLTFDVASGATITESGAFSAAGNSVTKTGDGTLVLSGTNLHTGLTAISAGIVTIQDANGLGDAAGTTTVASGSTLQLSTVAGAFALEDLILNGGTLENLDANNEWAGTIALGVASFIKCTSGTLTCSGTVNNATFLLTLQGSDVITISGVIGTVGQAGSVTLDMDGIYAVNFTADNVYEGVTTINGGNLTTDAALRIDDLSVVTLADAAIAKLTLGGSEIIGGLSGGGTSGGDVVITGAFVLTVDQASDLTFAGDITGAALTKAGLGRLILSGTNSTYSGALLVTVGTVRLQHSSAAGLPSGGVVVTADASLELQGGITIGDEALTLNGGNKSELLNVSGDNSWAGAITLATAAVDIKSTMGTLTLGAGGISGGEDLAFDCTGHVVVSGVIAVDVVKVDKTGTGTLQLDGANLYTGATTISGGTLAGIGSVTSVITMANATTMAPGGSLGNDVGDFTIIGDKTLTFNGESKYVVTVTGSTTDKIVTSGDITATNNTPNVEIQSGFIVASIVVPIPILEWTLAKTYTAFDESQLPTGFNIDDTVGASGAPHTLRVCITSVPLVTVVTTMAITVTPTNVPKGAYVNGGGVPGNDNQYWQMLKVSLGRNHPDCGVFTLYMPGGMYVADSDDDGKLSDEISYVYEDPDNKLGIRYLTHTNKNQIAFAYYSGLDNAFPDGDEVLYIMFPVETDQNPAQSSDDYYIAFGNTNPVSPTYKAADLDLGDEGGLGLSSVGSYIRNSAGTVGVIAAQEANVVGTSEYIRVVYSGADFGADDLDVIVNPEDAYGVKDYDISSTISSGPTDVQMGLMVTDGDAASFLEGSYLFAGVVNQETPCALIISSLDKTGADSLYVAFSGGLFEVADAAVEDIGPGPNTWKGAALVDGTNINSISGVSTYGPDNMTDGQGASITYKSPGPNSLALVSFASNLSANNDTTSTYGEMYPSTTTSTYEALPDLVVENAVLNGTSNDHWSGANFAGGTFFTLDDTEDGDETPFYLWASQDSTLSIIESIGTGAYRLTTIAGADYTDDEAGTGSLQYDTTNLSEGDWYFYITSPLSGGWSLARSGILTVRHNPYVKLVGWDYNDDGDGSATPGFDESGDTDDFDVTLDSGNYIQYDNTKNDNLNTRSYLNLYLKVVDYDDNAQVKVFFSTITDLDAAEIDVAHGEYATKGALLTGATAVKDTILYENSLSEDGYLKLLWDIDPDEFGSVITSANYTLYAVADDGKNQSILASKGSDDATTEVVKIKHSPNLNIDVLTEYDSVPGTTTSYTIDVAAHDVMMLSWGKTSGPLGDMDSDDSCLISFFLDKDDDPADGKADYESTEASDLATAGGVGTTTIRLVDGISEDLEDKLSSFYAWNFNDYFTANNWSPTAGTDYHLYAIIDENKEGGTKRVVALGDGGGVLQTTDDIKEINFTLSNPFVHLMDPPADGASINAEETYKFRFSAFDWDDNANIGIFLVKTSGVLVDGDWGAKQIYSGYEFAGEKNASGGLLNLGDNEAICLTSSDGSLANGSWLSENSATSYDFTISLPSSGKVYTKDVNDDGTGIADGEYWVYIGVDDGSYDSVTLSLTSNAAFNTGDFIVGETSGAVGLVTSVSGANDITVYRSETAFANSESVDIGTVFIAAETTTAVAAETAVTSRTGFSGGIVPLYRAPGTITVVNSGSTPAQRNLSISPSSLTIAQGDTASYTIKAADNGNNAIDRIDTYIAVDKTYWALANSSTPFTAATEYVGKLLVNTVIDDDANNRWILRLIVDNGEIDLTIDDAGLGESVVTFKLISKGTSDMEEESTVVEFLNEGNYRTKFVDGGVNVTVNTLGSSVAVQPRGLVKGIVELEGRTSMQDITVTFDLRERGSYANLTDDAFYTANGGSATEGVQFEIDNVDGNFVLTQVPTGKYDLVASYNRYLSKLVEVDVNPGVDTLSVSFGTLLGGDCVGYTSSLGVANPDNQIDDEDKGRVRSAFLATSASSQWDYDVAQAAAAKVNWKWADINEDGIVEEDDLSMITANYGTSGAQPVYKSAVQSVESNVDAVVEFMNVPSEVKAGETYTIQIVASNVAGVRAYFINLDYDSSKLTFEGISKGDFFINNSYSFPVVSEETVGLANSTYGHSLFSGDGVLAEVSFTATRNGVFSPDMLGIQKASLVNSAFMKEHIKVENLVGVKSNETPVVFSLGQNFPNPFNPITNINFTLPDECNVTLKIYDILGRHIDTLVDEAYASGNYSVVWNATDTNGKAVSAGLYFYTIDAGSFRSSKKMLLMK